jgi:ABC-type transport system substrate-binding protein
MLLRFFRLLVLGAATAASTLAIAQPAQNGPTKVFRYAFPIAETGFDPAQISDLYSRTVAAGIFESLLGWDYLARPPKAIPVLAADMPEISPDFKTFTFKIRPGIYFADDAAFKGQKREVTAQDFVYSFKRHYDPKFKSFTITSLLVNRVVGLNQLRSDVIKNKTPFPYDQEVEGVRALDRYTLQFKLEEASPRFHLSFTDPSLFGVVAREVVEAYSDKIMEHPVGTGAFKLSAWKRSSRIVLERNPGFREQLFNGEPPADDKAAQEILARYKGKRLPLVDRVEISVIEEQQPRWLAFLNAEHDFLERLPNDFANIAIPNNKLAPNLARQGIKMERTPLPDITITYFNIEDPIVGGYTPDKVALRRAISLAYNSEEEIRLARRNQAILAHAPIAPMTTGYNPKFVSEMSEFSRPRAKALLDMFGYVDKNGDGWRDMPDGSPLILRYATQPDQNSRQLNELWKKNMDAVGIRVEFQIAKWPDQLKQARAGKLQMWALGFSATGPDPDTFIQLLYGPAKGENNLSRFDMPEYNALYEKQKTLPDGPERQALIEQAKKIMVAYMPYKAGAHRIATDLMHPWVFGFTRHPFQRELFKFVDVDPAQQAQGSRK